MLTSFRSTKYYLLKVVVVINRRREVGKKQVGVVEDDQNRLVDKKWTKPSPNGCKTWRITIVCTTILYSFAQPYLWATTVPPGTRFDQVADLYSYEIVNHHQGHLPAYGSFVSSVWSPYPGSSNKFFQAIHDLRGRLPHIGRVGVGNQFAVGRG